MRDAFMHVQNTFKLVQVCSCYCKMFRELTFFPDTVYSVSASATKHLSAKKSCH